MEPEGDPSPELRAIVWRWAAVGLAVFWGAVAWLVWG